MEKIIEGYGLFDLPGFFIQSGIDLFKRAQEQSIQIELLKGDDDLGPRYEWKVLVSKENLFWWNKQKHIYNGGNKIERK